MSEELLLRKLSRSQQKVEILESMSEDVTRELYLANKQLMTQLNRLDALRSIDSAISASFDLNMTLDIYLEHVTAQLGIDAANVLLLNRRAQMLQHFVSKGFFSDALKYTRLKLGESNAGRAALDRRIVTIPDLREMPDGFSRSRLFADEVFVSYFAAPLISKGKVMGVLELFHRNFLEVGEDWMEFLETLAKQGAIAIDNASLFNDLQRSHEELIVAYDETIEGWSRALDYRDNETENHSQRVTDMTLMMASEMGMGESELPHVRHGSLLHDIGKLGVPDHILFKPGKLTEEEWAVMKRHPEIAYELLSPISYLRPAIDIPYCHHEKWDGCGYPRGLEGEEIPLAARIFAVVDVWDALCSDRPYRPAWTREKVVDYLQSNSGSHFAPKVVETFLKLKW